MKIYLWLENMLGVVGLNGHPQPNNLGIQQLDQPLIRMVRIYNSWETEHFVCGQVISKEVLCILPHIPMPTCMVVVMSIQFKTYSTKTILLNGISFISDIPKPRNQHWQMLNSSLVKNIWSTKTIITICLTLFHYIWVGINGMPSTVDIQPTSDLTPGKERLPLIIMTNQKKTYLDMLQVKDHSLNQHSCSI